MKNIVISVLLLLLLGTLAATDFTLNTGATVIGTLYGIKDGSMYVVDASKQLLVLPLATIAQINDGFGDVAAMWKRKPDFMKELPAGTATVTNAPAPDDYQTTSLLATTPSLPAMSVTDQQLRSISKALWTMITIEVVTVAVGVIAMLVIINNISKPIDTP